MKYYQPYGISDPDAPYINGNPATGTMGSIPPAQSIEHPQREIVNFINKNGLTPTDADLLQLSKAVQRGFVNYGQDVGAPNDIQITPIVPVGSYQLGHRFIIKMGFGSTSQCTVNVSGLGKVPLIHTDLTPMAAWELTVGQLIEVAYDGANFQLIAGGASGGIVMMANPRDFYVNNTIGSDELYDGTSAVIAGVKGGPFKTIHKAFSTMKQYNLGGWNFNIHVADGNYTWSGCLMFPLPNGTGHVVLTGNTSNPDAVTLNNIGTGSTCGGADGGNYDMAGFNFRATAPQPGDGASGMWWRGSGVLQLSTSTWGACPGAHFMVGPGASAGYHGANRIIGNAANHLVAFANGILYGGGADVPTRPSLTIPSPVNIGCFVSAGEGGQLRPWFSTINGAATGASGSNITGQRYSASTNGVIQTASGNANYLPGTIAGSVGAGGQYA